MPLVSVPCELIQQSVRVRYEGNDSGLTVEPIWSVVWSSIQPYIPRPSPDRFGFFGKPYSLSISEDIETPLICLTHRRIGQNPKAVKVLIGERLPSIIFDTGIIRDPGMF